MKVVDLFPRRSPLLGRVEDGGGGRGDVAPVRWGRESVDWFMTVGSGEGRRDPGLPDSVESLSD